MSTKETSLTIALSTATVIAAVSTVLHFTPWPHNSTSDTINIPYTSATLTNIKRSRGQDKLAVSWDGNKLPRFICILGADGKLDMQNKYPLNMEKDSQIYRCIETTQPSFSGDAKTHGFYKIPCYFFAGDGDRYELTLKMEKVPAEFK